MTAPLTDKKPLGSSLHLISRPATWAVQPPHLRCAPEPNGAQESPRRVSKTDRKTVVPSYSALSIYWKSQSDPSSLQESLPCPDRLRDTAGTVKPPSACDQTSQTRRATTKQSPVGICKIPMNPIKAWSQISTLSWLRDHSTTVGLLCCTVWPQISTLSCLRGQPS